MISSSSGVSAAETRIVKASISMLGHSNPKPGPTIELVLEVRQPPKPTLAPNPTLCRTRIPTPNTFGYGE